MSKPTPPVYAVPADLAPEAVKLPAWAWVAGMRVHHVSRPFRVLSVEEDEFLGERVYLLRAMAERDAREVATVTVSDETFPDLADAATGGVLLTMLGEGAHYVEYLNGKWAAWHDGTCALYAHLGEACAHLAYMQGGWKR